MGGIGWYRKHFRVPEFGGDPSASGPDSGGPQVELRFDGVHQNADVWLNGVHLGFHPYGYTAFAHDLTPHLNPTGPNVLAVTTSRDDLAHVLVEVTDSHGRLVPDATLKVMFQVDGAGESPPWATAIRTTSTASDSHAAAPGTHGQALAILRPAKTPGRVTLTASSPGLRPAALTLAVGQQRAPSDRGQP
ncbi:sugar-binding domain-containing protein [Streptomyces mirabilis]|uniref:Glycosyl hydrolases family 2, sugar binding domain n=1 Tax=Streptomyces mirabilis TaxID=68239 RepID=A0A1I2K758_9ACTN|nr:sugar-binding domain-containing protein [Streptomyces mirabilis]SFF61037.1 Glycosyl hydrolases family 2, sugar binding domain [Streptomyces mirabilis]